MTEYLPCEIDEVRFTLRWNRLQVLRSGIFVETMRASAARARDPDFAHDPASPEVEIR